jgi:hypothetical protein
MSKEKKRNRDCRGLFLVLQRGLLQFLRCVCDGVLLLLRLRMAVHSSRVLLRNLLGVVRGTLGFLLQTVNLFLSLLDVL